MIIHVLPGDAYVDTFRESGIEGEVAIFRECLIEGDLSGENLDDLWRSREQFLTAAYPDPDKSYRDFVVREIDKFAHAKSGDEVNLWFEYELFCSVNYWFCLNLLSDSGSDVYRVAPTVRDASTKWRGFGRLEEAEFIACFNDRVKLNEDDIKLGRDLWNAFRSGDTDRLLSLGTSASPAFPYLIDVTEAAVEMDTKLKKILAEVMAEGVTEFAEIFPRFARRAGVYGLGDLQVKRLLDGITR
ncbi:MAG TPA: hypothetical protein VJL58_07940 [Pyrinomonadaceae bacterium]|nr:hypothetical protein [Pyrinomonadaceae bacterium]